jgi:hypothetical protein
LFLLLLLLLLLLLAACWSLGCTLDQHLMLHPSLLSWLRA